MSSVLVSPVDLVSSMPSLHHPLAGYKTPTVAASVPLDKNTVSNLKLHTAYPEDDTIKPVGSDPVYERNEFCELYNPTIIEAPIACKYDNSLALQMAGGFRQRRSEMSDLLGSRFYHYTPSEAEIKQDLYVAIKDDEVMIDPDLPIIPEGVTLQYTIPAYANPSLPIGNQVLPQTDSPVLTPSLAEETEELEMMNKQYQEDAVLPQSAFTTDVIATEAAAKKQAAEELQNKGMLINDPGYHELLQSTYQNIRMQQIRELAKQRTN